MLRPENPVRVLWADARNNAKAGAIAFAYIPSMKNVMSFALWQALRSSIKG
jgi:hypothetical protein